ncbi:MAG: NAD+ synthase [Candidatus Micrarchaeota archaeon]
MDYEKIADKICARLREYARGAKREVGVVGLSGGVDSAVTAALTARAFGAKNVIGVIMPTKITKKEDADDARALGRKLGIRVIEIDIEDVISLLEKKLCAVRVCRMNDVDIGNLAARVRMAILYNIARREKGLVIGTGDKSEISIGYFTKYGDGGVDILPIGDLYKTEVRGMARALKIQERIVCKPASPGLWRKQTAERELGACYEIIDEVLRTRGARHWGVGKKILRRAVGTEHKRKMPEVIKSS